MKFKLLWKNLTKIVNRVPFDRLNRRKDDDFDHPFIIL